MPGQIYPHIAWWFRAFGLFEALPVLGLEQKRGLQFQFYVNVFSQGRPVASFDPEGLIFAVGVQSEQIKLYDVRSFDKVSCQLL